VPVAIERRRKFMVTAIIWGVVLFILLIITIATSIYTVEQQTAAVIERFGKFVKAVPAGIHLKWFWGIDKIVARESLRVRQLDLDVETKTVDDVFVILKLAVQYSVPSLEKVKEARYSLVDHVVQMNAWVFDVVRSKVPTLKLDQVFENKDEIAQDVEERLRERMGQYGWQIVRALVNDVEPDAKVKAAMNEVNTQQRLQMAAQAQGEKEKILVIKNAEAEAESKRLQGEGIANQRRAIIKGYKESIQDFQQGIPGTQSREIMDMVVVTQYFDTLQVLGADARSKVIFMPSTPGAVGEYMNQVRSSISQAMEVKEEIHPQDFGRPSKQK
jgi:regulator of protease activity HflC (stomatin/prohibitin superfamily)